MRKTIAVMITSVLIFTGCSSSNAPTGEEQVLTSKDGMHTVTIPGGWRDEEDRLNPVACLAASNRNEEEYVIVLPNNRENLSIIYPDFDLQKYSDYVVETMTERMGNPTVGSSEPVQVGGHPAVRSTFSGEVKNTQITYWLTCVELENYYIQLIGWTSSDRAEGSRDTILGIHDSYTFSELAYNSATSSALSIQKV